MNKKRVIIIVSIVSLVIVSVVAAVIGISKKSTYKGEIDSLKSLYSKEVGLATTPFIKNMQESLPDNIKNDTKYVVKIKCTKEPEFDYQSLLEFGEVLEVFKGDGINVGDNITIYDARWSVSESGKHMNMWFVNFMKPGDEYLVYLTDKVESDMYDDYYKVEAFVIPPIFNYEDKNDKVVNEKGNDKAEYGKVKDFEFFAANEQVLDAWKEFKKKMMAEYGQESH